MQRKSADQGESTAGHSSGASALVRRRVPTLTIVSHPDLQRAGERVLLEVMETLGVPMSVSRNGPDFARPGASGARPLDDPFLSRTPLMLEPRPHGGLRLMSPMQGTHVRVGDLTVRSGGVELTQAELGAGVPLVLAERVVLLLHLTSVPGPRAGGDLGLVGPSEQLQQLRDDILRVADLQVPVLIRGETGTGKELVARAIHEHGPRRSAPFVSVNLGALSKELVASELFGAQRGAYTGASRDREGFFRAAHGGTLLLDEVGEAPAEVQTALLRVLETGEVYPVGSHVPVPVDVRLVAATDADLETRIAERLFKAPLLHRLAGFELRVPALRERREDMGPLFLHFARRELAVIGEAHRLMAGDIRGEPWLPASLVARLLRYAWPGNVRQLHNVTRQLVIGSRGLSQLRVEAHLEQLLDSATTPVGGRALPEPALRWADVDALGRTLMPGVSIRRRPSDVGEQELLATLRASGWDLQATAVRLGISRSSVYLLIDKSTLLRSAGEVSPEELTRCFHECAGDVDEMAQRLEVSRRALLRRIRELGLDGV
ncbi:sigma-54-dependent Fis family transcriptional regulator [Myxococcus sp. CA033]|uniref:sigma 54-interacting transcriptional regulator n=1 Tax=Myxococcus sp. CA033 TaxID=2741516 RepID=UPI00157AEA88|nr:sigma-54 dependent transcriptional regulator [Myxococcus sp. CA033]NTX36050.1 sigma-54-dependent Fis family transcriptional regulator [Myxococcus sp. CA033]